MENVCVIGVGFVGKCLIDIFSKKYDVVGYDTSHERVCELNKIYFGNAHVKIQSSPEGIDKCGLFCISVPTLLTDKYCIDDKYVTDAVKTIEYYAKPESVVVMESSVCIGMTRRLLGHLRDKNIYVGFSPERIDPGRENPHVEDIPKIISGIDDESLVRIGMLYGKVFSKLVKVSTMETAEMCKLSENCFRMINIAYANELLNVCHKWDIDTKEMIDACATKPFGYMPFYPGLGVGGHCIPINPYWLAATNAQDIPLLMSATEMMEHKPINEALKLLKIMPNAKRVLVVGVAFKSGEVEITNSPSISFVRTLMKNNVDVTVYDPRVCSARNIPKDFRHLDDIHWSASYIDDHFDVVCVTICQPEIDFTILDCCAHASTIRYN